MRKRTTTGLATLPAFVLMVGLAGCSGNSLSETQKGAAIGTGAGVLAGGLEAESILSGGALGAAAGAAFGELQDQEFDIRDDIDSAVRRPAQNAIAVDFREDRVFEPISARLSAEGERELEQLARVLDRYQGTAVVARVWSDEVALADARAEAVEQYLERQGLASARVEGVGLATDGPGVVSVLVMAPEPAR